MAYSNSYEAGDVSAVVVDIIVLFGIGVASFMSIIVLVALYRFFTGGM